MPLKNKYATAAEVPAELKSFYLERDGAWHLDAERDPKVEEMRQRNVDLLKENALWKQRFDGIDPDAVRALAEEKRKLEEEAQLKAGEFNKVLAARLADQAKQFAPVSEELKATKAQLATVLIDNQVIAEATKRGLRPTAMPDLVARARAEFRVVGGVPKIFDGDTVRMGKDGVTPMISAEWVDGLVAQAPHLFEANAGGGAVGSGTGGAAWGGVNPWSSKTLNLTEQVKILKSDPGLAARLKALAN